MRKNVNDPVPGYGGRRLKAPLLILISIGLLAAGSISWYHASDAGGYNEVKQLASVKCLGCLGLDPNVPGFSEFWLEYPSDHQKAGKEVQHPDLVTDILSKDGVDIMVLFFWTQGCVPCAQQWEEMVEKDIASGPEDGGVEGPRYDNLVLRSKDAAVDTGLFHTYTPTGVETGVPMTTFLFRNTRGDILWWSHYGRMDIGTIEDMIVDIDGYIEADRLKNDYDDISSVDHLDSQSDTL